MAFVKGQSGNPKGGKKGNKGGGRTPDWLKTECRAIVDKKKLVERLAKVASGAPMVPVMSAFGPVKDKKGKQLYMEAPIKAQIDATKELLDRGFGKAVQQIESTSLDDIFERMREKYK